MSQEREGPYEDLVPVPLSVTTLYCLGVKTPYPKTIVMPHGTMRLATTMTMDDMRLAAIIGASPLLESELTKQIPPHAPVSGFMAFDSVRRMALPPGQMYLRVTIRDSASNTGRYVVPFPRSEGLSDSSMRGDNGSLDITGLRSDISSSHVKYYSEPFPALSSVPKIEPDAVMVKLRGFMDEAGLIQTRFDQTHNEKQLVREYQTWSSKVLAYLANEKQLGKSYVAQFRDPKVIPVRLSTQSAKAEDVWARLDARNLVLSRILSELKQRQK